MSEANRSATRRVREIVPGTTPNNPAFRELLFTSSSIAFSPENVEDDSVTNDRQVVESSLVGYSIEGDQSYRMRFGALDEIMEASVMNSWVNQPRAVPTGYVAATGTHTVGAGLGSTFAAGDLILVEGYSNAANNGVKKVASVTGTTIVTGAGGVDEPAPPLGVQVTCVGWEGGAGIIAATAAPNTLTGVGLDTLGLIAGEWVLIGGAAAGQKFANSANNGWARVSKVAAGVLTFDSVPIGWAADAAAGKTIRIWIGDRLRNGTTDMSDTIEREITGDDGVTRYRYFRGVRYNFNIEVQAKQLLNVTTSMMGMSSSRIETARQTGATTLPALSGEVFDGSNNVKEIRLGGTPLVNPNIPLSFSIGIDNSWRTRDGVGIVGTAGVKAGTFRVTGNVEAFLGDATLVNNLQDQLYFSVAFPTLVKSMAKGYFWDVARAKFTDGGEEIEGRDTDISPDMEYLGHRTTTAPYYTLQIQRFNYLEV